MKKIRLTKAITVATLVLAVFASSTSFGAVVNNSTVRAIDAKAKATVTSVQTSSSHTWAKAKTKVLNRIPGGSLKYMKLVTDDGIRVFEGAATKGNYLYEFQIRQSNGRWIDWERDYIGSRSTASKIGSTFSKAKAKAKIKNRVPNSMLVYIKLVRDDGRWVYEGEAYKNGYLYDFELNAFSGRWVDWEREWAF